MTLKLQGSYTALNGTWHLERDSSGEHVTLTQGTKVLKFKYWKFFAN